VNLINFSEKRQISSGRNKYTLSMWKYHCN